MKKIVIIMICLFLLLSAVNFGSSKPTQNNYSTSETDYSIDRSVIDKAQEHQILQNINRLDGYFTEKRGQVENDSVRYYIQGKGVWFLDDGVVFKIQEPIKETEIQRDPTDRFYPEFEPEIPPPRKSVVLKLNFVGCNEVEPKGVGQLLHRSNYFYGNDSGKWCTNVPNFQEIIYENIYDNIDLRYYLNNKGLKYDFIVKPDGKSGDIRLKYEGAQNIYIEDTNLIIQTDIGNIIDSDLFIYQNNNEKNKIDGNFKILDSSTYCFKIIGHYDSDEIVTIDPLLYSTFVGGSDHDYCSDISIDNWGNSYVTGQTESTDFPNSTTANDTTHNNGWDVFLFKLSASGQSMMYSTYIGGSNNDYGLGLTIDSNNNSYATGRTSSPNFPYTLGANDTTYNGNTDVFVVKLNETGSLLLYSTFIGGTGYEEALRITNDSLFNIYVTGNTFSSNFPTTAGANDTIHNGGADVFIFKLDSTGAMLQFSTFIGGSANDNGGDIVLDENNNTYITGWTDSANFPITNGAYDDSYNGLNDIFVTKLNSLGSLIIYSTYIGGVSNDFGKGITLDSNESVYVTGESASTNFPTTPGAYRENFVGLSDIIIFKLNTIGTSLNYSTFIGGPAGDIGSDIAIDSDGIVYITGNTESLSGFPTTPDAYDNDHDGGEDVILIKMNHNGTELIYSTFIGGSHGNYGEKGYGIAVDTDKNAYVTGSTNSANFPSTPNAYDPNHDNIKDGFIFKMGFNTKPSVLDLTISNQKTLRSNQIWLSSNATDKEDVEQYLTPYFEYRDPNEQVWNNTYFTNPKYINSYWMVNFTPPLNASLGFYDFRVQFNDTENLFSDWFYLNDQLLVLNNIPIIEDMILSNNSALLGDSVSIWTNATDIEEIEENLTIELEYRDPTETSWDIIYLSDSSYINGRWEYSINIPFDAMYGYYDFRVRCNDRDGNYSAWLYLNDSLNIYNTGPKVINIGLSRTSIYRTDSIFLYLNGTDYETPEDMLLCYIQYKPQNEDEWINLTGNYLNNTWEVSFTTNKESILDHYDFRVKFEDNETASSGWIYVNGSLEVLNNLPTISEDLDDNSVGIQPLVLDLTPYESDIEDTDENLTWSINPQIYTYIESATIIDTLNDTLKIVPKKNVTGTEDIELTLTDKDSGFAVKSDITIIIDSTISEFTPKVTILSPPDKTTVNTLTPTLKWELDYSGTEIITYSVALDENPDPQTTIKTDLTTTEYILENELVDGKTYYWKVEPTNGICLSGAFRFTIDLGFEPIFKVNLSTERDSVTIKQGESKEINLTVTNEGNSIDNFKIEISSDMSQSDITIEVTNGNLEPGSDSIVILSIDIPDDFTIGDYSITVTATSLTDITAQDEVIIDVKVVSKDFKPEYDVSISVSPSSLNLKPGDSENVTITITNDGNIEDDFTIKFESDDFTSANIQFSESSLPLAEGDSDSITVTITIPEDMEPGVYTIKFIVESGGVPKESTLTITLPEKDDGDGDEDNTMLYALIGIIVIIIVVLILLFIFLKKKKGKEEEAPVEEVQPPLPEELPTEALPPEQPQIPVPPPSLGQQSIAPTVTITQQQMPQIEPPPAPPQPVMQPKVTPRIILTVTEPPATDDELEE